MKALMMLGLLAFAGCAQTVFYDHGQRVACFQGDMRGMIFKSDHGTIYWCGDVSHSEATRAQQEGAAKVLSSPVFGTAATLVTKYLR